MRSKSWFWRHAFFHGVRKSLGVAALVLATSSIGFGALAHDSGISLTATVLMMLVIWALPGQVILITVMNTNAGLAAAALAVTLSAVRLMPMVASLLPVIRTGQTPRWVLALIAHMIAATTWLEARRHTPGLPAEERVSFVLGHALGLVSIVTSTIVLGYFLAAVLPTLLAAGLMFLIPIYFLVALIMSASIPADYISIFLGAVLGPVFAVITPNLDLMFAGVIGGTLAYGFYLLAKRRAQ